MKLFRNKDIQRELILFVVVGVILTGVSAFWLAEGAVFVFIAAFLFTALHLLASYKRYKRIEGLADDVAHFLHGFTSISFSKEEEGELAILETEIGKMVQKLRTQTELLQKEKSHLADSIADISHQLRTPLTSLNLILTHLRAPDQTPDRRKQYIREMEALLIHVDWLIETLLKISKLDAGIVSMQSVPISVNQLVEEAAEVLLIPMELKGQELICEIAEGTTFRGDFPWIKEALMNVLKNCMEHTPEKGEIHVTAVENALFTEIRINDNGPGIDKEDLPHLFERFYKGKISSEKSVGIGLALARSIITGQGGVITAHNRRAGGAEFVIRFYKSVL